MPWIRVTIDGTPTCVNFDKVAAFQQIGEATLVTFAHDEPYGSGRRVSELTVDEPFERVVELLSKEGEDV